MKLKQAFLLFLAVLFCQTMGLSQPKSASKVFLIQQMDHFLDGRTSIDQFFSTHQNQFQLAPDSKWQKLATQTGKNEMRHHKYQQLHRGIPVYGATYWLHEKASKVASANGYFRPLIDLESTPSISAQDAKRLAQRDHRAKTYVEQEEERIKLCFIDPAFPSRSEQVVLAYQLKVQSSEPFDKQLYFIDAHTGRVVLKFPLLHANGVPAKAKTKYYGEQDIIVDSIGPDTYHLHDDTRGNGISTYHQDYSIFTNDTKFWDLTNEEQDEVALDAHYCTEKFYDLLFEEYQWNGLDNQGESMNSVVHARQGTDFLNAFWDGNFAWFGDGNCNNGPLTTLEVVGHEFTHGIIQRTSNLVYAEESGAINEHLADVFGKALEYREDPANFTWAIGKSFQYIEQDPFRSMEDPASLNMPDFYKGQFWYDGAGVHTNSSVGNHWFYLLSEGESGTNEVGQSYDIPEIGLEKAAAIVFQTNRNYLGPSSNYSEYYELSILATMELYGNFAPEVDAVREAWKAVGLPSTINSNTIDLTVSIDPSKRFLTPCLKDEYLDLDYIISNLGNKSYGPSDNGELRISYYIDGMNTYLNIPLEEEIQAGESITYNIPDAIFFSESTNLSVRYNITLNNDSNQLNNSTYNPIYNSVYPDNEMRISSLTRDYDCVSDRYQMYFFLYNESCNPLPAGTNVKLSIADSTGLEIWSEWISLPFELASFDYLFVERQVAYSSTGKHVVQLSLAGDPNPSNNQRNLYIEAPKLIDVSYLNDFNDEDTYDERMHVENLLPSALGNYDGEQYFTSTAIEELPGDLCINHEDNFRSDVKGFNMITGLIYGCLDFSYHPSPTVEFDLVQFRDEDHPMPSEKSTMMQFSWEGDESGNEIYFGQTPVEIYHYAIDLPPFFKGNYHFKFANRNGQSISPGNPSYLEQDVNFIDNILFQGYPLAAKDIPVVNFQVYPNPANQELYLSHTANIEAYIIINAQGQILLNQSAYEGQPIDLSGLAEGYYWLKVWTNEDSVIVKSFVKMNY